MKKTLFFAAALLSLAACNKAVIDSQMAGEGSLSFSLNADDVLVSTKATVGADVLANYKVILTPTQDGQTGWTKTYADVIGQTFVMSAGTYKVYAENITALQAETGNGALRVAAPEQNVTVTANQTGTATLNCVTKSSKIVVEYTKEFTDVFTNYSFVVSEVDGSSRADGAKNLSLTNGTPAFYNGSVTLQYTLTGTHELNGNKTLGGTIDLTEGHSLKVVVNQSSASGGLGITITANDELIADEDHNVTIDPYL